MKAELLSFYGSDKMIVDVARVSYGKIKEGFDEKDIRLIKFLAKNEHTSPFRHPSLQFRVTCPIFVERQIFKHRFGCEYNSISGRYVDFSDTYWMSNQLRYQSKDSKQGSAGDLPKELNDKLIAKMVELVNCAQLLYEELEEAGVAKEQCRVILPLCLETTFIGTFSLQAFIHLCKLRLKPDAQKETRDLVAQMLELVKNIENQPFKNSLAAFGLDDSGATS